MTHEYKCVYAAAADAISSCDTLKRRVNLKFTFCEKFIFECV